MKAKKNGDKIGDLLNKLLLNSLYGRYAMNSDDHAEYKIVKAGERPSGWELHQMTGERDIIKRPAIRKEYYDVAVAASITGYARAALLRGMATSEGVVYCDTDSVVCREFGGEIGDKLGQWKFEGEFTEGYIVGKKSYAFNIGGGEWKTAHKGISKLDIDVKDIIRASTGESVIVKKSAPCIKISGEQNFFSRTLKIT